MRRDLSGGSSEINPELKVVMTSTFGDFHIRRRHVPVDISKLNPLLRGANDTT